MFNLNKMDVKDIILNYCSYRQQVIAKLLHLNNQSSYIQSELRKCARKRSELSQIILSNHHRIIRTAAAGSIFHSRTPRSIWMHPRHGSFWEKDVPNQTDAMFKESFRMERTLFNLLVEQLKSMKRTDTNLRTCIPLEKRIAIALYALGSSAEYRTIANLFGVSKASVCNILNEFCREVWRVLGRQHLKPDFTSEETVMANVKGFEISGFPQCFGAMDGCHVEIRPDADSAVDYYNYKGWYSTNLFALVNHRCQFMYISVGTPGRCNDSYIFEQSSLKTLLQNDIFKRKAKIINGVNIPVVVLGDSAFKLSQSVMKPYPFNTTYSNQQKVFNYVLSKCRRVVENAFGHLKARFRRIGKGIDNHLINVNALLKCACALHNFLNEKNSAINNSWIDEQANYEASQNCQQPPDSVFLSDFNPNAEKIRSTIAQFLADSGSGVGGSGVEASNVEESDGDDCDVEQPGRSNGSS